ncbi:phospholipid-translocating p-type flippase family protein, putative [Ichthyophthirius multifiliis]|uniref:Phospholipid-transporting ATPase n=1 Tax=Ichthyophthirius multifiliis TaxID=5932 RepID=G0R3C0_ICHMU|nr:phospholipid-translocating p-type flippase family protein, putative [Ichthyophthirius multifiliis]EGR28039.1 phospholipid-translocating p-type flippase family protein, putative [Ichthyophthirius multifiliis]|eukprot:XP_004027384.1 phospholipid-translocating p-type flippase family protein, putative [Ichthyophthirius multifiliis]
MSKIFKRNSQINQNFGFNFQYANNNLKSKDNLPKTTNRKITSNRPDKNIKNNSISTSKYTYFNFLPKNIYFQFTKIANLYFLISGFLQMVPQISTSDGVPTIFLPLFVIIIVTAFKDFYEDYKRHASDNEENNRESLNFDISQNLFRKCYWKNLYIGNIVKIQDNELFPADLLILSTSEPKGMCYIETKSLDGETNLKQRNAQKTLYNYYGNQINQINLAEIQQIVFQYELPNQSLYKFQGTVEFADGNTVSIDNNNILLRGCKLKNTQWVLGLVAYTGHETKIMMNSFSSRSKKSQLEIMMGRQIIVIFLVQIVICIFCGLYYMIWYNENSGDLDYLYIIKNSVEENANYYNFLVRFGNWILLFNNFVPISLLVTLELVKFAQAYIIANDENMAFYQYDEKGKLNRTPTTVQSSNLNEELGQIEYVFSDKTGTLTCNIMEFKKISINGVSYGEVKQGDVNYIQNISQFPKVTNVDFRDKIFINILNDKNHKDHKYIKKTIEFLALTHTVITEQKTENGQLQYTYNASSPDELALVNFARYCGAEYRGLDLENNMLYNYKGIDKQVLQLHVFEFDSDRKRQSIVIKELDTGKIKLFCKGADSVLFKLMDEKNSIEVDKTKQNLDDYGNIGLRTLLLCEREISQQEYDVWLKKYHKACTTLTNRELEMSMVQAELEQNLILVGATAIEDKLQDQVGETIFALKESGIKVWVLTGDKVETAINIGFSCKLITQDLCQYIVKLNKEVKKGEEQEAEKEMKKRLSDILKEIQQKNNQKNEISQNNVFIIAGDALTYCFSLEVRELLIQITNNCTSVLCCRVTPTQKQQIVTMVRNSKAGVCTLAIGDGANDVNMINAAHVGIGIKGLEGQQVFFLFNFFILKVKKQAARASDYSIGEFKILRNLLFYYGREAYRRNTRLICFNFFKNIVLVVPQFWYSFNNSFSGQILYDNFVYQLFNVLFASLPIMIYAILDEEYDYKTLIKNQKNYYKQGIDHVLFNSKIFWGWFFNALLQSLILAYFSYYSLEMNFVENSGYVMDFWQSGQMVFGLAVVNANMKVLIISFEHSIGSIFINFFSMILYLCTIVILSFYIESSSIYYLFRGLIQIYFYIINKYLYYLKLYKRLFKTANFHIGNALAIAATSLFDLALLLFLSNVYLFFKYLNKIQNRIQEKLGIR